MSETNMGKENRIKEKQYRQKIYNIESWQNIHVGQLAYFRNLIIILSTAALGYTISIFSDNIDCVYNVLLKVVSILYLFSTGIGFIIAYYES